MALSYNAIADGSIDANSAGTVNTFTYLRDNPIASHKYVVRSGDHAGVTNSTTLVDDGVLQFACDASQAYMVHARLIIDVTDTDAGARVSVDGPAGVTLTVIHKFSGYATIYYTTTDDDAGSVDYVGGADEWLWTVTALVVVGGTEGTIKIRYAQSTAIAATTTTIKQHSVLCYHRVDDI